MKTEIFYHPYIVLAVAVILSLAVIEGIIFLIWGKVKKRKRKRQKRKLRMHAENFTPPPQSFG